MKPDLIEEESENDTKGDFIQISGHKGICKSASSKTIYKKLKNGNNENYAYIKAMKDEYARVCIPRFFGALKDGDQALIELENLMQYFKSPNIMDIKLGCRTFEEEEVQSTKLREDLYDKMLKLYPDCCNEKEKRDKAITKLRYMQVREKMSTTSKLSFRIEAVHSPTAKYSQDVKKITNSVQVLDCFKFFLNKAHDKRLLENLVERINLLRRNIENSEFFQTHQIIGSSLLLIHDGSNCGAWIIDLAHAIPVPDGVERLNHRSDWKFGNGEDGILTGLDNIIRLFRSFL